MSILFFFDPTHLPSSTAPSITPPRWTGSPPVTRLHASNCQCGVSIRHRSHDKVHLTLSIVNSHYHRDRCGCPSPSPTQPLVVLHHHVAVPPSPCLTVTVPVTFAMPSCCSRLSPKPQSFLLKTPPKAPEGPNLEP